MFVHKYITMNETLKQTGIKFGFVAAVVLIATYLLFYIVDYTWMNSIWIGFGMIFMMIVFGSLASYISKQKMRYITFKEAFIPYFITIALAVFASTLFLYLLYGWIDTDTAQLLKENSIELTKDQMRKFGVPDEQAGPTVELVSSSNPYGFGTLFMSAATRILILSIPGLIAALAFRNKSEFFQPQK